MRVWVWFLVLIGLCALSAPGPRRAASEVQALGDYSYPDRFWCYGSDAHYARHHELPCADLPNYERRSDASRD
jgi:hypothetical protein